MLVKFKQHIDCKFPELRANQIFVAVSGGLDSMVLLHLIHEMGLKPIALHCNFNLRGNESDLDAQFVKETCKKLNIQFRVREFDTKSYMQESGRNTQNAARDLRYGWFEKIAKEENGLLLTAHHQSDLVETFMINLARGSGIKGLASIPLKREYIRRPFTIFTKNEILNYAQGQNLNWRDDSSNVSTEYLRNELRLDVLPKLENWYQGFSANVSRSLVYLSSANHFINYALEHFKNDHLKKNGDHQLIDLSSFQQSERILLEMLLLEYGFSSDAIEKIMDAIILDQRNIGIKFKSSSHELVVGRNSLDIFNIGIQEWIEHIMTVDQLSSPLKFGNRLLSIELISNKDEIQLNKSGVEFIDASVIGKQLVFRKPKTGDKMKPLGMKGNKLLSDIMIDEKWDASKKREAIVLESNGQIAWLSNFRVSEEFKVKSSSENVLKLFLS